MKKEKGKLTERFELRLSEYEKNFIKGLSNLYAGGNMSLFIIYACFNCDRKFLKEDELKESKRIIRKK